MAVQDTYFTIREPSEGLYKEKGSKFFAFVWPVNQEDDIKAFLKTLKKKYYDARHHCFGYVLGPKGEQYRAYDDGEPGHSAGDPILGQIRSRNLTDTLVVVVRYFGGTKLGVPGLIHAYKTAASNALDNNQIIKKEITEQIEIHCNYASMNTVMRMVKEMNMHIARQQLSEKCHITLKVRLGKVKELKDRLSNMKGVDIKSLS